MQRLLCPLPAVLLFGCAAEVEGDGGTVDTGEASAPPALQGQVQVSEAYMPMMDSWMLGAEAGFYRPEDVEVENPTAVAGSCSLFEGSASSSSGASADAGSITIVGDTAEVQFTLSEASYEATATSRRDLFEEGQLLDFEAEGGEDVPAFVGTIEAPPELDLWTPDISDGSFTVARTEDLTVSWEPHEGASIHIELSSGSSAVSCSGSDGDGELIIPVELLEMLPASSGMMGGMIMMDRTVRTSTTSGDALVTMEVQTGLGLMGTVE